MTDEGGMRGEVLATVATVNDLHFGETVCGLLEGVDIGPVLRSDPDSEPYPTVMNSAAASEIATIGPDLVVAKGDLTANGSAAQYAEFDRIYGREFGSRLVFTLGNHDKPLGGNGVPAVSAFQLVDLDGVRVVVLDTSREGMVGGALSADQVEQLDEAARGSDRPVLVLGHHPVGGEDIDHLFGPRSAYENGLDPRSTGLLVSVVARRPSIAGYFAGHTHRNKVRHLSATGGFPWVEVACVKDFPGSWAEYRVRADGISQVHHRISQPDALAWSERCRAMFAGRYPLYSLGEPSDRCFEMMNRSQPALIREP